MTMELFTHQKEGVTFLKKTKRAILADEMGLGKTRQAIVAAGEEDAKGILIICPASLKINWEREIRMVYPEDEIHVVYSGPEEELPDVPWLIINYDMLTKYKDQLIRMRDRNALDTAIIDEAHYIKGKGTERADATLEIIKDMERVYALTGTPVMNRPIELFNILRAIKHPLGKARTTYAKRYCGYQLKALVQDIQSGKRFFVDPKKTFPFRAQKHKYRVMIFGDETGATRLPELRENIDSVFLRRTKKEVIDLPEKIVSTQIVEMEPEYHRAYTQAWDSYIEWVSNHPEGKNIENILSAQALIELGKLKQVCSLSKIARITEDVENAVDSGEKVIVFSQYTKTIGELMNHIGKDIKCVRLTGEDDAEARQAAVDAFTNDPETKVFIANIKAGGVGLNLTAATIVMFADMEWSPELHAQAEDRAHRIGQEGTVNIYYYVAKDTIEEDIVELLGQKKAVIGAILEGHKADTGGSVAKQVSDRLIHKRQA